MKELPELIINMQPELLKGRFVFFTSTCANVDPAAMADALALVREPEGLTLVLPESWTRRLDLSCSQPMAVIRLMVHSSLEAVGLTAAVSSALAGQGISANMLAGFHHDLVLVPSDTGKQALSVLQELSRHTLDSYP